MKRRAPTTPLEFGLKSRGRSSQIPAHSAYPKRLCPNHKQTAWYLIITLAYATNASCISGTPILRPRAQRPFDVYSLLLVRGGGRGTARINIESEKKRPDFEEAAEEESDLVESEQNDDTAKSSLDLPSRHSFPLSHLFRINEDVKRAASEDGDKLFSTVPSSSRNNRGGALVKPIPKPIPAPRRFQWFLPLDNRRVSPSSSRLLTDEIDSAHSNPPFLGFSSIVSRLGWGSTWTQTLEENDVAQSESESAFEGEDPALDSLAKTQSSETVHVIEISSISHTQRESDQHSTQRAGRRKHKSKKHREEAPSESIDGDASPTIASTVLINGTGNEVPPSESLDQPNVDLSPSSDVDNSDSSTLSEEPENPFISSGLVSSRRRGGFNVDLAKFVAF
jgi:hypothetical protein